LTVQALENSLIRIPKPSMTYVPIRKVKGEISRACSNYKGLADNKKRQTIFTGLKSL
jgi:hypothetical protein